MSTGYASPVPAQPTSPSSPGAKLAFHLQNGHTQHMDGRQTEYPQSGLSSPFTAYREQHSEDNSADQASAAQYPQGQDPRGANFSSSATPTSEYGLPPSSARSGSFPEYIQRQQHYTPTGQGAPVGGMAQAQSPSQSGPDGHASSHNGNNMRSDADVPIDPSIAAASPTYPPQHQYSPYQPQHEMSHYPAAHPGVYGRPDWASPGQYQQPSPHMPHYGHSASTGPPTPAMVSPVQRPPTVGAWLRVFLAVILLTICRVGTRYRRSTHSSRFQAHNSTSARVGDTKKLNACTSVVGTAAKRLTERLTI